MTKPIFVFHTDHQRPGHLGILAQERFGGYEAILAHRATSLPDPAGIEGPVVIFGGPMGVPDMDSLPWMQREVEWIGQLLDSGHRVLGVCLGAQLMAHALGQTIVSCERGSMECGYHPLHSSHPMPSHAYQWHRNGIILDPQRSDIRCMATSDWLQGRATQAFSHRNAIGLQFHPETSNENIEAWLARDSADLNNPGTRPAHTHLDDHALFGPRVKEWLTSLIDGHWGLAAPDLG